MIYGSSSGTSEHSHGNSTALFRSMRVFGSTTRVARVSSDDANIAAEHQESAEVLSQLARWLIRSPNLRNVSHKQGEVTANL